MARYKLSYFESAATRQDKINKNFSELSLASGVQYEKIDYFESAKEQIRKIDNNFRLLSVASGLPYYKVTKVPAKIVSDRFNDNFSAYYRYYIETITVVSVAAQTDINVVYNTAFGSVPFITPVSVLLSNGSSVNMAVSYAQGTYNQAAAAQYTLTGTLTLPGGVSNPGNVTASVRVTVGANQIGFTWTSKTSPSAERLTSIAYGNGVAVAVGNIGTTRCIRSIDNGETWNTVTPPEINQWRHVCFSQTLNLFCAVSLDGTNRVMTSADGLTWTARAAAAANQWAAVTWSSVLNLFCAVAISGTGNRVMTSPDGTTWTSRTSAADLQWFDIDYGNGMFIAVAAGSTSNVNKFMRSTDGTNWTAYQSTTQQFLGIQWVSFLSLWIVAAGDGTTTARVLTSPDGITFTPRTTPNESTQWEKVASGDGIVVIIGSTAGTNRVITSPDGLTWTVRLAAQQYDWFDITFADHKFIAVANNVTVTNKVMVSI